MCDSLLCLPTLLLTTVILNILHFVFLPSYSQHFPLLALLKQFVLALFLKECQLVDGTKVLSSAHSPWKGGAHVGF